MSDDDLDAKFLGQATNVLPPRKAEVVLKLCRGLAAVPDVGRAFAEAFAS
jgi:hypothetical protein